MAHEEGIYTLGMNTEIIASGGDDSKVRIWTRQTGDLLQVLDHHEYIVWNLRLHHGRLISFGYDCKVCTYTRCQEDGSWTLTGVIQGTDDFADALATDDSGRYLTTHVEDTVIWVWDLEKQVTRAIPENDYDKDLFKVSQHILELRGHEIDILCVKFALNLNLILSGSSDQTIRVWDLSTGVCLKVLQGHSGKVWSLDLDRHRILSGGRHGEIRIWHLEEVFKDNDILDGDTFEDSIKLETIHSSSTAIGQVILDQAMVISADGLGEVVFSDFWTLQEK